MSFERFFRRSGRNVLLLSGFGLFEKAYNLRMDQCEYCDYDFQELLSFLYPCTVASYSIGFGVAIVQEVIDFCANFINENQDCLMPG